MSALKRNAQLDSFANIDVSGDDQDGRTARASGRVPTRCVEGISDAARYTARRRRDGTDGSKTHS